MHNEGVSFDDSFPRRLCFEFMTTLLVKTPLDSHASITREANYYGRVSFQVPSTTS